jgi:hypothetical protein
VKNASINALASALDGCKPMPSVSSNPAIQFRLQPLRTLKNAISSNGQHSQ